MPEHLLNKEWIALRCVEHDTSEGGRRDFSAESAEDRLHIGQAQAPQRHPRGQFFPNQIFEHLGKRPVNVQFQVAISPDHQHRHGCRPLRQMLKEEQCWLVGPMQILKDGYDGRHARRALHELAIRIEQESALLFRRQFDRLRNVGIDSPQFRHQLGHFRRGIPQGMAERFSGRRPRRVFQHLDERHVGGRAFPLIAVADDGEKAAPGGLRQNGSCQVRLADAGLAADQRQRAAPGQRRIQATQ